MRRVSKNRYLDALLKLVLFSAITHIIILLYKSISTADPVIMNYFNILDLELFFKGIEKGTLSQVLSFVVVLGIYVTIFFLFTRNWDAEKK
ncbi:MAG: hypothetical protein QGH39_12255 [Candidatus Thermoplasmatota archaeon]|jgi:hypothetical protein|nr:hypothetical protein [Candidatus Thermoplasmatota archaeon]MDP7266318.1 hypothetical protein [Candidatus Thermoplasmatota archaeon]